MEAAEKFSTELGTAPACRAFGVSRASLYRRRQRATAPAAERARPRSHRALSGADRQEVLDLLHSGRFLDQVPAQVCAALLTPCGPRASTMRLTSTTTSLSAYATTVPDSTAACAP